MDAGTSMDICEHEIFENKEKRPVLHKHSGKETGLDGLRSYLAGVSPYVTPREEATSAVGEMFRNVSTDNLAASKTESFVKVQLVKFHERGRSQYPQEVSVSSDKGKSPECVDGGSSANCFDFSAVEFLEFVTEMMMTKSDGTMPDYPRGSKGCNFYLAQMQVKNYVKFIRDSWEITGCSILLDAWVDEKGRDLVIFVADCPAGPLYLTSMDVSHIKHDLNALMLIVDGLVDGIVGDVIQIVACSASGWVGELGEFYKGKGKRIFWSVGVSHCFELMLLKIEDIFSVGNIFDSVNMLTDFINSNPTVLKLVRDEDRSIPIDKTTISSEFEFFLPYLTLESIFRAKNHLAAVFAYHDNKGEDARLVELVNNSTFWRTVERVLKCTSPLIHGLLWFSKTNNQHIGNIYETMDVIKESIAMEFNNKKPCYQPLWDVIDSIWDKHLHSPLHAVGYFLNPAVFDDLYPDSEVTTGLLSSVVRIVKQNDIQVKVSTQLEKYRVGEGCFNEASLADQITGITPGEWWAQKAIQYPELQSFAIKVLSQTCQSASMYKMKSRLTEKLVFTRGMSRCEKARLFDLAAVHYNLHLKSCKAKLSEEQ